MSESTVVMSFPTRKNAVVEVVTTGLEGYPYRWTCSASDKHRSPAYAALPFCRNDAKTHAETCRKRGVAR